MKPYHLLQNIPLSLPKPFISSNTVEKHISRRPVMEEKR